MEIEVGGIFGFILLVLVIWAIVNVVRSDASTGAKVLWVLFLLIVPLIGFVVWLITGPRSPRTA